MAKKKNSQAVLGRMLILHSCHACIHAQWGYCREAEKKLTSTEGKIPRWCPLPFEENWSAIRRAQNEDDLPKPNKV